MINLKSKCFELNNLASSLNSKIMGYLSENLKVGQQKNFQTPLASFQLLKQNSSKIAGNMAVSAGRFILPSFCSMLNTLNCDNNSQTVNIQVVLFYKGNSNLLRDSKMNFILIIK